MGTAIATSTTMKRAKAVAITARVMGTAKAAATAKATKAAAATTTTHRP